jgi:hypothetical protein
VTISVLAIISCAPIGGMFIMNLGPILLSNKDKETADSIAASESRTKLHDNMMVVTHMEDDRDEKY